MKKIKILLSMLLSLFFVSCIFEDPLGYLPGIDLNIDKLNDSDDEKVVNVSVNEKVEISGIVDKIFCDKETDFILCIEDYPEDFEIEKGELYNQLTTDKYLCIKPVYLDGTRGEVELKISFKQEGEFSIKIKGCSTYQEDYESIWNEDLYTYKFIVSE